MPIVNLPANPPKASLPTTKTVQITPAPYQHNVVDSRVCPNTALLTHIEGSSMRGDFFSQVLGGSEELSEFQPSQISPYQQYHQIKNYEIKLQGSLSTSSNDEDTVMTVTGTAIIYPFLKPNRGDVWISDIGDGRAGQFTITSVSPKTIFKETCYEINIELSRYADEALITLLESKVVQTSQYVKDFLTYGQNPIISDIAMAARKTLSAFHKSLLTQWVSLFYSTEYKTFLVPGQVGPTYDPYVTKAILRMYDQRDHPIMQKVKELNVDGAPQVFQNSVWDAILNVNEDALLDAFVEGHLISATQFNDHAYMDGVRFSGINYIVGAKVTPSSVDKDYKAQSDIPGFPFKDLMDHPVDLATISFINALPDFVYDGDSPLTASNAFLTDEVPAVHAIAVSEGYFLSKHFYENTIAGMSKLELFIRDMLTSRNPNKTALYGFCESARTWGRLEQFYYIPVLLAALKVASRTS